MQTIIPAWRTLLIIAIILIILLSLLALSTRIIAPQMLFHPHGDAVAREKLLADPQVEPLNIPTSEGALSGYFLRGTDGPAPLILYFAGNGENAATTVYDLTQSSARRAPFAGCHFAQVDYPGYGLSEGRPSDEALKRTALAAYDMLAAREDVTQVIVLGYSIGTGPANYCASSREVSGLMLMAPYADGVDLFNNVVNLFHGPLALLVSYDMSSITFAEKVAVKPLIFATEADALVPYASSLRLSRAYPAGCDFVIVPEIGHDGFWRTPSVLAAMGTYVQEALAHE